MSNPLKKFETNENLALKHYLSNNYLKSDIIEETTRNLKKADIILHHINFQPFFKKKREMMA